ncbi:OPSD1-like protein [Mya arenaria]|uniref:OPSD1-like protein n=2 Tax=Mya arenaria TaxID=6604 RepID=A0ABY7DGA3_MYAAR|nr:OPSD1-like protein [Mya arenaria]
MFVLNLTVADFLLAVGNMPMFTASSFWGYWVFGSSGCIAYAFAGSVASFVSINTLAAIAIDRCFVIIRTLPLQNRMSRKTFCSIIGSVWIYSILWASGPFVGFGHYILEGTNTSCTFDFLTRDLSSRLYVICIFTAHFIIPVLVIAGSYTMIFRTIKIYKHEFNEATKVHGEEELPMPMRKCNTRFSHEAKTARVSIIVISVFCISWTPYATVALIGEFGHSAIITRLGSGIPCLLAKCSTIINPLIYALLHPKFRTKLLGVIACFKHEEERREEEYRRGIIHFRSRKQCSL